MADGKPSQTDPAGPGPNAVRDRVEQAVLDTVFAEVDALTRVDLATRTGLSKPTINSAVRRLEQEGLLAPAGLQTGRQGRVATFYEIPPTAGAVVAVELNPTVIRVAVSDLRGNTVTHHRFEPVSGPAKVREQHEQIVVEAAEQVRRGGIPLRAVAVSVAKPVDPQTLDVVELPDAPYPDPEGLTQLAQVLSPRINAPLLMDNDVNLAALGEQHAGVAKDVNDFAYLYVGAGVGGGIVLDRQLMRGSRGLAGEVGYLPSRADVSEGRHGLAHALAALGLGPRRQDAWYADTITEARTLLRAAENGDRQALDSVAQAGRVLGEAAMAIVAVIDPEFLVLGGPIGVHPLLLVQVQETLNDLVAAPIKVIASALGENAPLEGALELAREHARTNL